MLNARGLKIVGFFTLALAGVTCFAQNPDAPKEPPKFYKLEFVVKELDAGKVINARTYATTTSTDKEPAEIRTESRVSVRTGPDSSQIFNVGVNIDCGSLKETKNGLSLIVKAEISSLVQDSTTTPAYPVIRQNKWNSTVVVQIRKARVVFSSDDTATKRQMQLELTATPIE